MGRYTDLARKYQDVELQEGVRGCVDNNINVKINNIYNDIDKSSVAPSTDSNTNLRTTNLTNLIESAVGPLHPDAVNRCIHGTTEDKCQICSGYVRWLIADETRFSRAQHDPEAVRKEFWCLVKGDGV